MEVKIQKLRPGAVTPRRGSADAAGYDLYACPADGQSVTIAPHATAMIGTGLALAIPAGYFGGVFARSGLASVTVIADDGLTADALSTALFVAGEAQAARILEGQYPKVGAVLIRDAGSIRTLGDVCFTEEAGA